MTVRPTGGRSSQTSAVSASRCHAAAAPPTVNESPAIGFGRPEPRSGPSRRSKDFCRPSRFSAIPKCGVVLIVASHLPGSRAITRQIRKGHSLDSGIAACIILIVFIEAVPSQRISQTITQLRRCPPDHPASNRISGRSRRSARESRASEGPAELPLRGGRYRGRTGPSAW